MASNIWDYLPTPTESWYEKLLFECRCGWKRHYTPTWEWKNAIISHPIYGDLPNMTVAQLDVKHHSCEQAARASFRARGRSNINV